MFRKCKSIVTSPFKSVEGKKIEELEEELTKLEAQLAKSKADLAYVTQQYGEEKERNEELSACFKDKEGYTENLQNNLNKIVMDYIDIEGEHEMMGVLKNNVIQPLENQIKGTKETIAHINYLIYCARYSYPYSAGH